MHQIINSKRKLTGLFILVVLNACSIQEYKPAPLPIYTQEAKLTDIKSSPEEKQALPDKKPNPIVKPLPQEFNLNQAEADLITAGLIPNPDFSAGGSLIPLDRRFTVDR